MKKILPLLLCFIIAKNISSQNGFTTYTATTPAGANPGMESAFLIDNVGNKWVGFVSGALGSAAALACYNASTSNWTYYSKTTHPTLPANKVTCLAQDNSGNIWIGTPLGLAMFNGTFTAFTTANGLPGNYIYSLETVGNMIYIGTNMGLSRYDGVSFTNYSTSNMLLPYDIITAIKAETSNNIWLGASGKLVKFYIDPSFTSTSYTVAAPTPTGGISSIYIDPAGNKWLSGFGTFGILKYDNNTFTDAATLYPEILNWDNILYVGKGPNNGVAFLSTMTTGGMKICNAIVELLAGSNFSIYPAPNLSYVFSKGFQTEATGKVFMAYSSNISANSNASLMYSFDPTVYLSQPTGMVTGKNFKYLDINRVKAGIANRGDKHWDVGGTGNPSYEVPKGTNPALGVHASFASALWLGGLDASNQLHTAAQTYRQNGNDFWPGPLDTLNAAADPASFVQFDKIWKLDYNDINAFITNFNNGNIAANTYTPVADILSWPAHGSGNNAKNLAPFVDTNGDGVYNPYDGDYPKIKGDQALYFIFNDNFAAHGETGGPAFGVEVHCMAYAYGCTTVLNGKNELAYTTFYDYNIYNRSNNSYHDVYAGWWDDVDLGCYQDDYIGSSIQLNMGFVYNSDINDGLCGSNGYDNYPPAAGTVVLKGPLAPVMDGKDNDNDGNIDEAGEECLMNIFDYYNNNIGTFPMQTSNPNNKYHYYNYLSGRWKDSTYYTCGGNAYGGTSPTSYVYPWANYTANPCSNPWTESSAGNLGGDRRYIVSSGPFDLPAKGKTEIEYAYVWSVDSTAPGQNIGSVYKLINDAAKVRNFYYGNKTSCLQSIAIGIKENAFQKTDFSLFPNPASNSVTIKCEKNISSIEVLDALGRTVKLINNINLSEAQLKIADLESGLYFINVSGQNSRTTKKLIKD